MSEIKIYIANETGDWVSFDNQFINYVIDQRYDFISDSFTATLVDNDADIKLGYWMHYIVDDKVEFRGLIEGITRQVSKGGRTISIRGRSKTCLLVSEYFAGIPWDYDKAKNPVRPWRVIDALIDKTSFRTKSKATQNTLTDPFMDTTELAELNTDYSDDQAELLFDRVGTVTYADEFKAVGAINVKIAPGSSIWQSIDRIVSEMYTVDRSIKFEVLYQNDNLYFGDLKKVRMNFSDYNLRNEDTLNSTFTESITNRYSTIALYSPVEYNWGTGQVAHTAVGTSKDSTLTHKKFFSAQSSGDYSQLVSKAINLREDQRYTSYQLNYTVPGHIAPNGRIWMINRYCNVQDNILDINEKLVIYGRTLKFSMNDGSTTDLTLSIERSGVKNL